MTSINELKRAAGYRAADYVQSGMTIGLGSGSTAHYATVRVAQLLRRGALERIIAIPTSNETAQLARSEGIPLTSLDQVSYIDVTLDGADEVDPDLNVIKGQGGFLLREKIVAAATKREIYVVDDSKIVERLGSKFPVATEVIQFGWQQTRIALESLGATTTVRMREGQPYITDEGNYILDCRFATIDAPKALEKEMNAIPGVIENGLFVGMVYAVVIASHTGLTVLEK